MKDKFRFGSYLALIFPTFLLKVFFLPNFTLELLGWFADLEKYYRKDHCIISYTITANKAIPRG
ncbi:MAG TPA: hypothetical protein VGE40_01410, partial [Bacilli bacterium]